MLLSQGVVWGSHQPFLLYCPVRKVAGRGWAQRCMVGRGIEQPMHIPGMHTVPRGCTLYSQSPTAAVCVHRPGARACLCAHLHKYYGGACVCPLGTPGAVLVIDRVPWL